MKYIRLNMVEATPMTRGDYNKLRGWTIPADENPNDEGYLVVDSEGYRTWYPKAKFDLRTVLPMDLALGLPLKR
jgi:hypothetical protein